MKKPNIITKWKAGDIIRQIKTGKAFLVLHVYKNTATILSDLEQELPIAIVLLPKKYDEFATDRDMEQEIKEDDFGNISEQWNYKPMPTFL